MPRSKARRRLAFTPGRRFRMARACRPPAISDQASRAVGKDRPGGAASSKGPMNSSGQAVAVLGGVGAQQGPGAALELARGLAPAVFGFRPGRPATVFVAGLVTI